MKKERSITVLFVILLFALLFFIGWLFLRSFTDSKRKIISPEKYFPFGCYSGSLKERMTLLNSDDNLWNLEKCKVETGIRGYNYFGVQCPSCREDTAQGDPVLKCWVTDRIPEKFPRDTRCNVIYLSDEVYDNFAGFSGDVGYTPEGASKRYLWGSIAIYSSTDESSTVKNYEKCTWLNDLDHVFSDGKEIDAVDVDDCFEKVNDAGYKLMSVSCNVDSTFYCQGGDTITDQSIDGFNFTCLFDSCHTNEKNIIGRYDLNAVAIYKTNN